jgi:hypothetical protein
MARCRWRILSPLVTVALVGCASSGADWFRIYDARAEVESLRSSTYAETVQAEVAEARELLAQAEQALKTDRLAEVAELAELVLLKVQYARARARTILSQQEAEQAEALLDTVSAETEAQRERLRQAEQELGTLPEGAADTPAAEPASSP